MEARQEKICRDGESERVKKTMGQSMDYLFLRLFLYPAAFHVAPNRLRPSLAWDNELA